MKKSSVCLLLLGILGACICGGRTSECNGNAKISLLTSIHDDSTCTMTSSRGVIMSEAAKMFIETHNSKNNNLKIDLNVLDTCGTVTGSTTAAMKALSSNSCLHPPYYLGLIGPESAINIDAVQKITSILNVPQIVNINSMSSPYLHHLHEETDAYIVQGILEMIEALGWKSFTLATPKYNSNNHKDDDIQVIAKKVTKAAISRGLCVMIHEEDDDDFTSRIIYIGKPPKSFFKNLDATVVIASEGNLKNYIDKIDYQHAIILLEDSRNDVIGIESRVENSKLWNNNNQNIDKFDTEEMREVRWMKDAVEIYTKSYDLLCKKKKCSSEVNHAEWNTLVRNVVSTKNAQLQIATRTIDIYLQVKNGVLDKLGEIKVKKNEAIIDWVDDHDSNNNSDDDDDNIIPESLKNVLSSGNDRTNDCATSVKNFKTRNGNKNNHKNQKIVNNNNDDDDDDDDDEISRVLYADDEDYEFWTVVAVVSGIGVSMFTIGILAVYVVFSNIRGPRSPKHKGGRRYSGNGSVIRRVNSERELQIVTQTPQHHHHQQPRTNQRRNSNNSIGSVISDRSV
ncbi:protein PFC0760c-like [Microplitis mediator]|uniref:protein PFC0760c-like n=1 Tax=Microplitis mediator TaxID=375433 RepID=UPI002553B89B|nr:protein PFC0760c-like [Microplitis mediator]